MGHRAAGLLRELSLCFFPGGASGLAGGIIRALADFARGLSRNLRFSMFAAACFALTLRGLNPLDATRLALFLPLVAVYVGAVEWIWRKGYRPRGLPSPAATV